MSKEKTAVTENNEKSEAQAVFEQRVTKRFRQNTIISVVLAAVVAVLSMQNYDLLPAVLRGLGIGALVWLYFYISYRRLMR